MDKMDAKYMASVIFLKDINTFIQQGCIKWIKNESKYIYNITKHYK